MKIFCKKTDLLDAIVIVQKAIKTNSTVQILDGILIQAEDGKVKLTGYDLETGIEADLDSDVVEEGSVVINSKYFGDVVKMLPEEMTTIEVDDRYNVSIISGDANTVLKGNPADSYPKIPVIETDNKITVSQKLIKDMVNGTIFAVSKDGTRQYLTGCNLESDGNTLTMVAIDGFRMALRRADMGTEFPVMNFIIPNKALNEAAKIFNSDDDTEVVIYNSSNHILFDIGDVRIISRLLGGPFVNYNAIIQKNPKTVVTIERRKLLDAVNRAALVIMTDERRCPVQIKMVDMNTLLVQASTEAGTHKETIDIETTGDENVDIDFNSKYLIEALKVIEDDVVNIEFNGNQGPCIIVPKEGNSYVYLVLPIRR